MRGLLDAHTFLWWATNNPLLSDTARNFIVDEGNEIFVGVSCVWEFIIKAQLGKLPSPDQADRYFRAEIAASGFRMLDIELTHVLQVYNLPMHHKDPFDRILIAQGQVEQMPILTADSRFALYDVTVLW